jgi:NAD-dependent deacetylase
MNHDNARRAAELLVAAESVAVLTGAGMSKESGFDTFRDENGLWTKFNPDELATPDAFRRAPLKVWAWYRGRRAQLATMEPHDGHRVLAEWERRTPDFTVITQNIDGLHHRAGSRRVIELHGRLDVARCTYCDYNVQTLDDLGEDPACPICAKRLRPAVVWFHEPLPAGTMEAAFLAAQRAQVFLVIGTSGVVQPAASLVDTAKVYGARVIEINPNPSEHTRLADVFVQDGCRSALAAIDRAWREIGS